MQFFVGTSAFSVPAWKGSFYPEKLPQKKMLNFYSQKFPAVEINSSFQRMPTATTMESWIEQTPDSFQFAMKAPKAITHYKRLKDAKESLDQLLKTASILKGRLGPILFQLPPNFKKDVERLDAFLKAIPKGTPVAFEFRHSSWFDDEAFDCLTAHSCALCVADADELPHVDLVQTAKWGYVRLRREKYSGPELRKWIKRLQSQDWEKVYVFFKHDDAGTGPKLAARFLELAGGT